MNQRQNRIISTASIMQSMPASDCIIISSNITATENKIQLLNFGALEYLVKLICHDDKLVKRNAAMCVGIVSSESKFI